MQRKPWPMRWIVLAMVLFLAPYTYLTLRYRKATSFRPYEDARERKHVAQAGYVRITLFPALAAEPLRGAAIEPLAPVSAAPGGLPADLAAGLLERPVLPLAITAVAAPLSGDARTTYNVRYACALPGRPEQWAPGPAHLYRKGADLIVVATLAPVADGLAQRLPPDRLSFELPLASLDPGTYRVTLIGSNASRAWSVQVH